MSPDQIFTIANTVALAGWVVLALLPGRRWIVDTLCGRIIPGLFAGLYVAILVTKWSTSEGGFSTLPDVALLFENPWALLAGWVHYLAFDMLIGTWEVRDARERGVPHLLVVPCLALTFLFGPSGWLAYMIVRSARKPVIPEPST
jgi:hypothetical protein